ncbi:hypothetical protein EMIHUDRAFT_228891 [Emiliania huxleyi CCMP1516]|uniref:Lipoxygenase domain-containing protein n=2 Tax=Emiliania huxleyi TaxID=2903 RepID=A0A0D3KE54_EMIH1|nr:hypothetical protein EMIHUDRAFT_228891 [Emiliania huxleyi CCMP1516]EOD34039.1 hypothetical protein EMIHUDRAFT_228891 [Emiliania huxleyi CCMP1516]|eukprot:XP_005786468.1 hypothetical protein EMIHUDRAFT_228891 [Emiliania huxleyi CCMP1516]
MELGLEQSCLVSKNKLRWQTAIARLIGQRDICSTRICSTSAAHAVFARLDLALRSSLVDTAGADLEAGLPTAARLALLAAFEVPVAVATGMDPAAHLDVYVRASGRQPFLFGKGIAVPGYDDVSTLVSSPQQERRAMVLAHPVLIADPVPPACMGGGTLIYLSTGAKHTALRRAIGRAVTGFALKRGRGPPLLFPRGAAPAEWDSRAVRETAPLLGAALDSQANATLETRLALKAAVLASPLGGRLRKANRADKLDADELAQQVADGLLFAGGYGTTHLTLAALERISSDPALYADPDAFLVESARLDPPVTSVSAIAPKGGQQLQGPGGGQLRVAQGVPMQLLLSHANRDPAVFERPYAFDPSRRNLDKVLSWNGVDAAGSCDYSASDRPSEDLELRNEHDDEAMYAYYGAGLVNIVLGVLALIVLGWFCLSQRLAFGALYVKGDAGIIRVQSWLGLLHYLGQAIAAFSWLRLHAVVTHADDARARAESASALRLCFGVMAIFVGAFAVFGTAAACVLFVPAAAKSWIAIAMFWWRHGGVLVLAACAFIAFWVGQVIAEQRGMSLIDYEAGSGIGVTLLARGLLGAEAAPHAWKYEVFARGFLAPSVYFAAAAHIDRVQGRGLGRAYPSELFMRRALRFKHSAPVLLALALSAIHSFAIPRSFGDITGCGEGGGEAAGPECAVDPTGGLDQYTKVYFSIIHLLDDGSQPGPSFVQAPNRTVQPLPKEQVVPGLVLPSYDEDEGLVTSRALANQAFSGYVKDGRLYPLEDLDLPWPEKDGAIEALMGRLSGSLAPAELYDYDANIGGDSLIGDAGNPDFPPPASRRWFRTQFPRDADFTYLAPLTVRPGFERYGAKATFDAAARPVSIWWSHGEKEVRPDDAAWTHAKFAFRSSLLTGVTLKDHLAATHLTIAATLVSASRDHLPATHPLRRLLKPFTYRTIALSLLHHTVALDAAGLEAGFAFAFNRTRDTFDPANPARFLEYPLEYPLSSAAECAATPPSSQAACADEADELAAFAADGTRYRAAVREYVGRYVGIYYADDAAVGSDVVLASFWAALVAHFPRIPPLSSREALVEVLTGFVFHVTAGHRHVGAAYSAVKDPRYAGAKIRPGRDMSDVQAAVQVLAIALVTGFKQPMLLGDYSHVFLRDGHRNATRALWSDFQAKLLQVSAEVDERNRGPRRFKVRAFDPREMATSVSI